MTHTKDKAKAATPHSELIAELLNPNEPKTEREHAAAREIERLQAHAPVQEPCDMGAICVGCSPRNADGSCPLQPNLACNRYVKGFNDGMKEMDGMEPYTTPPAAPV